MYTELDRPCMCAAERVTDRCAGTVVRGACVRVCVRESTHFCTSESTRPSCGCSCSTASGPSLPAPSDTAATASGSWWRGRPGGGHAPLGTRRRSPARYTRLDTHARAPAGASVGRSVGPSVRSIRNTGSRRHGDTDDDEKSRRRRRRRRWWRSLERSVSLGAASAG